MRIGDTKPYAYTICIDGKKKLRIGLESCCEDCPMGWDDMSYEGECNDCGCYFNYDFNVPRWKCILPRWVKNLIKKRKGWKT